MKTIDPKNISTAAFHSLLLGAVAPRPIAFASTIDETGNVNLSPFSFFNCFSANPPILIFSPARRVRDNTTKHTLENAQETKEVVINIVNYKIVEQMSLASTEYEKGINEFVKSGLTEAQSEIVKPPRVAEAPAAFECKVNEIIQLGDEGGAGNLIICEVVLAHFQDEIFDVNDSIDPYKLDPVARMGGNWYCRASGESLFEIPKPIKNKGIGVDEIPESVKNSRVLTGNNLGRLGNIEQLPDEKSINEFSKSKEIKDLSERFQHDRESYELHLHQLAKDFLEDNDVVSAWKTLLQQAY